MRRIKQTATAGIAALSLALAACGGATEKNENPETALVSATPVPSADQTDETAASRSSDTPTPVAQPAPPPRRPVDEVARELEAPPPATPRLSPQGQTLIADLVAQDIRVEGDEESIAAVGEKICLPGAEQATDILALAVAGQLVEQQRSPKSAEETAEILKNAARKSYC